MKSEIFLPCLVMVDVVESKKAFLFGNDRVNELSGEL